MLTPHQERVAKLLMAGQTPANIAKILKVRITTIKFHLTAIYKDAEVKGRFEYLIKRNPKDGLFAITFHNLREPLLATDSASIKFAMFTLAMKVCNLELGCKLSYSNLRKLATTLDMSLLTVRRMAAEFNDHREEYEQGPPPAPPPLPPPAVFLIGGRHVAS